MLYALDNIIAAQWATSVVSQARNSSTKIYLTEARKGAYFPRSTGRSSAINRLFVFLWISLSGAVSKFFQVCMEYSDLSDSNEREVFQVRLHSAVSSDY